MPTEPLIGQRWAAWIPGRQQWLLTTVVRFEKDRAILKFDSRYGIQTGQDEYAADTRSMLSMAPVRRPATRHPRIRRLAARSPISSRLRTTPTCSRRRLVRATISAPPGDDTPGGGPTNPPGGDTPTSVPEPASWTLLIGGIMVVVGARQRRRKKRQ